MSFHQVTSIRQPKISQSAISLQNSAGLRLGPPRASSRWLWMRLDNAYRVESVGVRIDLTTFNIASSIPIHFVSEQLRAGSQTLCHLPSSPPPSSSPSPSSAHCNMVMFRATILPASRKATAIILSSYRLYHRVQHKYLAEHFKVSQIHDKGPQQHQQLSNNTTPLRS
jgi:hypothetical protein